MSVAGADSNDKGDTTEFEVLSAEACGGDSGTFIGEGDIAEIETLSAEACGVGDIAETDPMAVSQEPGGRGRQLPNLFKRFVAARRSHTIGLLEKR